jgi:hypothetical protein
VAVAAHAQLERDHVQVPGLQHGFEQLVRAERLERVRRASGAGRKGRDLLPKPSHESRESLDGHAPLLSYSAR